MNIWHLVILAVVVVLIFGTGKLSSIGPDLGAAIRGFKKNLNGEEVPARGSQEKMVAEDSSAESRFRQETPDRVSTP